MSRERASTWKVRGAAAALALLLLIAPRAVRADAEACVNAHANGQREMKAGKLVRAGELFAECGATPGCPGAIRAECADFYAAAEQSTPTVLFGAKDASGADIADVKVYIDGQLVADGLNGRSNAVDPGNRRFRFVLPGGESVEREVLIRQGEKNRLLSVTAPPRESKRTEPAPADPEPVRSSSLPPGFWIAAGVGTAALGTAIVFAALGGGNQSEVESCAPSCGESSRGAYDAMQTQYLIADISFGLAAASAGVATWFLLTRDSEADAGAVSVTLRPAASPRSAAVLLTARGF